LFFKMCKVGSDWNAFSTFVTILAKMDRLLKPHPEKFNGSLQSENGIYTQCSSLRTLTLGDYFIFCTEQSRDSKSASRPLNDDQVSTSGAPEEGRYASTFNRGMLSVGEQMSFGRLGYNRMRRNPPPEVFLKS